MGLKKQTRTDLSSKLIHLTKQNGEMSAEETFKKNL